jgi:hypothetical protein
MSEALGQFLRDVPALHQTEKPVSFDPVQTTFLQKLVREATLQEGVTVDKKDFFAAIAALDYFTEVIAARSTLLHDIAVVVEELDKMADYLDPDLELLIRYMGVYITKDLKGEQLFKKGSLEAIARRHEKSNAAPPVPGVEAGEVDLYHRALGQFVSDQARRPEVRDYLARVNGRNDLRAALLIDAIWCAMPEHKVHLAEGKILDTLIDLLKALVAAAPGWSLREHVERLKARLA